MESFLRFLAMIVMAAAVMLVVGAMYAFPVMLIWNWLMPELFGMPFVTFWQAFWGTFLCSLLFKSSSKSSTK
jgi:hypothetical protein